MKEINPAFIQVVNAYDFTIEHCKKLDKTIIKSKDSRKIMFWWDSTQSDDAFWDELRTYFNTQGVYLARSRW
jgi:hypothetical protein